MDIAGDIHPSLLGVEAEFNYLAAASGRPRILNYEPPEGVARDSSILDPHRLRVESARAIASSASLDVEGFALLPHRSAVTEFADEAEITGTYYRETEALLCQLTGADRVVVFDHTIRRRIPGREDARDGLRQPVLRVHVDHTERSGPRRVRDLLGDDAEALLGGRVEVVNLWRPIHHPAVDTPLAVCDARSVAAGDLVATDLVYPDRTGEIYSVAFNPAHRWFYVPEMRPDEALLIKCYDSETDGRARFAPHSAFLAPDVPADAPPRESIELRTFVFHRR